MVEALDQLQRATAAVPSGADQFEPLIELIRRQTTALHVQLQVTMAGNAAPAERTAALTPRERQPESRTQAVVTSSTAWAESADELALRVQKLERAQRQLETTRWPRVGSGVILGAALTLLLGAKPK